MTYATDFTGMYKRNISGPNAGTTVTIARRAAGGGYDVKFSVTPAAPLCYEASFVARLIRNGTWVPVIHPALQVSEGL